MKNKSILLLLVACLCALFFASVGHAQDFAPAGTVATAPTGVTADNIVQWLTPLLVPLIITGFKKFAPSIPTWVLPILAPVLGVLLDVINSYATNHSTNLVVAALLGLAGVGVREIKTNIIKPKEAVV